MQPPHNPLKIVQLSEELRRLCCASDQLSHACAEEQGIYLTDFRALLLIRTAQRKGRTVTAGELAAALNLSSGAVTYLVERLVQSGHMGRETDSQDRRRVLLRATDRGVAVADSYFEPLNDSLTPLSNQLGDAQMTRLLAVLETVNENLGQHAKQRRAISRAVS